MIGTNYAYPDFESHLDYSRELLIEDGSGFDPHQHPFVFAMHQGYSFVFFDCNAGDDPPVFMFTEGMAQPKQIDNRFSEWLRLAVDETIVIRSNLKRQTKG